MITYIERKQPTLGYRVLSAVIVFIFVCNIVLPPTPVSAQLMLSSSGTAMLSGLNLPVAGAMVTTTMGFTPALIKGIKVNPDDPFKFNFFIATGDTNIQGQELRKESIKLIKYFLASLTVPEKEMWVNLSPYEKDRIIPDQFGITEMGRDLLAQDYLLKQLTASLMYPEEELGRKFWDKIYKEAYERYGTTDIPVNTFNKVWILPEKAVVYEHESSAFVVKSRLRVMLEEDYEAMRFQRTEGGGQTSENMNLSSVVSPLSSEIIKEIILPAIEREVNEGQIFANLRQIYDAMILASWYKDNLKESLLGQVYVDQNKTLGVDVEDREVKQKIYEQYLEAFKKGVYNYIKEDYDPSTRDVIPRKYFSGGFTSMDMSEKREDISELPKEEQGNIGSSPVYELAVKITGVKPDADQKSIEAAIADLNKEPDIVSSPIEIAEIIEAFQNEQYDEVRRQLDQIVTKGAPPGIVRIVATVKEEMVLLEKSKQRFKKIEQIYSRTAGSIREKFQSRLTILNDRKKDAEKAGLTETIAQTKDLETKIQDRIKADIEKTDIAKAYRLMLKARARRDSEITNLLRTAQSLSVVAEKKEEPVLRDDDGIVIIHIPQEIQTDEEFGVFLRQRVSRLKKENNKLKEELSREQLVQSTGFGLSTLGFIFAWDSAKYVPHLIPIEGKIDNTEKYKALARVLRIDATSFLETVKLIELNRSKTKESPKLPAETKDILKKIPTKPLVLPVQKSPQQGTKWVMETEPQDQIDLIREALGREDIETLEDLFLAVEDKIRNTIGLQWKMSLESFLNDPERNKTGKQRLKNFEENPNKNFVDISKEDARKMIQATKVVNRRDEVVEAFWTVHQYLKRIGFREVPGDIVSIDALREFMRQASLEARTRKNGDEIPVTDSVKAIGNISRVTYYRVLKDPFSVSQDALEMWLEAFNIHRPTFYAALSRIQAGMKNLPLAPPYSGPGRGTTANEDGQTPPTQPVPEKVEIETRYPSVMDEDIIPVPSDVETFEDFIRFSQERAGATDSSWNGIKAAVEVELNFLPGEIGADFQPGQPWRENVLKKAAEYLEVDPVSYWEKAKTIKPVKQYVTRQINPDEDEGVIVRPAKQRVVSPASLEWGEYYIETLKNVEEENEKQTMGAIKELVDEELGQNSTDKKLEQLMREIMAEAKRRKNAEAKKLNPTASLPAGETISPGDHLREDAFHKLFAAIQDKLSKGLMNSSEDMVGYVYDRSFYKTVKQFSEAADQAARERIKTRVNPVIGQIVQLVLTDPPINDLFVRAFPGYVDFTLIAGDENKAGAVPAIAEAQRTKYILAMETLGFDSREKDVFLVDVPYINKMYHNLPKDKHNDDEVKEAWRWLRSEEGKRVRTLYKSSIKDRNNGTASPIQDKERKIERLIWLSQDFTLFKKLLGELRKIKMGEGFEPFAFEKESRLPFLGFIKKIKGGGWEINDEAARQGRELGLIPDLFRAKIRELDRLEHTNKLGAADSQDVSGDTMLKRIKLPVEEGPARITINIDIEHLREFIIERRKAQFGEDAPGLPTAEQMMRLPEGLLSSIEENPMLAVSAKIYKLHVRRWLYGIGVDYVSFMDAVKRMKAAQKQPSLKHDSGGGESSPKGSSSPIKVKTPGGIDLNRALLDLEVRRDGNGIPLPAFQQPFIEWDIGGFIPVIINVVPVNLPLILGFATSEPEDEPLDSAKAKSQNFSPFRKL